MSLKIAVHDEIEPMIFPKLVQHFQQLSLDIQLSSMKLDRKNIAADLASQQVDFVIDLEQNIAEKIQFERLVQDEFVVCTQLTEMSEQIYLASPHIGVSSRRTGVLVEDIYLNRKQYSRQIFLRCQHYSTALQILQQQKTAMLTIPKNVLAHLQLASCLNVFKVPVELPEINMGIEKRVLRKITVDDCVAADQIFSKLMGDDVEPRREFIEENARFVDNLDI